MTFGDTAANVLAVMSIIALVVGAARVVWRWLQKSKQKEIEAIIAAEIARRAKEQEDGTPVEKELRRQLAEIKSQASKDREQSRRDMSQIRAEHRQEIDNLRAEHDREINDIRRSLASEVESLRGQLTEAYRTRPNNKGTT